MIDDAIVTCQDVRRSFGGIRAVDGVSLEVRRGSLTGLIGPNGAGKSTLLDIIAGRTRPDGGSVRFGGVDVTGWPSHRLGRQGLVRTFQRTGEFPSLTVLENMLVAPRGQEGERLGHALFRRRRWKEREQRDLAQAWDLLERFELAYRADTAAAALSGGQKRLLELARALMAAPVALLLDEPLAGVESAVVDRLCTHLLRLNGEGLTCLIVSHELSIVERLCDTVLVMAQGKVLAEGSMHALREDERVVDAYLSGA